MGKARLFELLLGVIGRLGVRRPVLLVIEDLHWADGSWMFPAMRRPEARVHFAGEHASLWIAWMNGALESGERTVQEILAADANAT